MKKRSIRSQLMDFVECAGSARRIDIIKYLRIVIQRKHFDFVKDRGYYSVPFRKFSRKWTGHRYSMEENPGYLMHPMKNDNRYFIQLPNKKYKVVRG